MLQWKSLFPTIGSQEEEVVVVVVVIEEYYNATSLHCSFFSQLSIPFAGVYLQPRIWWPCMVAFFLLFLVINQHSEKSLLCTFRLSISDACKYSNAKSSRSREFYMPSTPFSILNGVNKSSTFQFFQPHFNPRSWLYLWNANSTLTI